MAASADDPTERILANLSLWDAALAADGIAALEVTNPNDRSFAARFGGGWGGFDDDLQPGEYHLTDDGAVELVGKSRTEFFVQFGSETTPPTGIGAGTSLVAPLHGVDSALVLTRPLALDFAGPGRVVYRAGWRQFSLDDGGLLGEGATPFVEDRWTAGPLTLNLGFRWELTNPVGGAPIPLEVTVPAIADHGSGFAWETVSPRIGLFGDATGERPLIRATLLEPTPHAWPARVKFDGHPCVDVLWWEDDPSLEAGCIRDAMKIGGALAAIAAVVALILAFTLSGGDDDPQVAPQPEAPVEDTPVIPAVGEDPPADEPPADEPPPEEAPPEEQPPADEPPPDEPPTRVISQYPLDIRASYGLDGAAAWDIPANNFLGPVVISPAIDTHAFVLDMGDAGTAVAVEIDFHREAPRDFGIEFWYLLNGIQIGFTPIHGTLPTWGVSEGEGMAVACGNVLLAFGWVPDNPALADQFGFSLYTPFGQTFTDNAHPDDATVALSAPFLEPYLSHPGAQGFSDAMRDADPDSAGPILTPEAATECLTPLQDELAENEIWIDLTNRFM